MPDFFAATAVWPGVESVVSCTYTASHGIAPGVAVLRMLPQDTVPAEFGDLVFLETTTGVSVTITDCKLSDFRVEETLDGFIWLLSIEDRRWKWRDLGQISGCYNQLDPHGKLIPWYIRSPTELAKLCLDAMGEQASSIDLPAGLTKAQGRNFGAMNPPWLGVIPTTGTNHCFDWVQEVPAIALARVCDKYGCHVILRWSDNKIMITKPGVGVSLPEGGERMLSPTLKSPDTPTGVACAGRPTRYQCRLQLEAVGEEWDGTRRLIHQLSYAPDANATPQITTCTALTGSSNNFEILINAPDDAPPTAGVSFATTSGSAATAMSNLATAINASIDPRVRGVVAALAASNVLTLTGVAIGIGFTVMTRLTGSVTGPASFVSKLTQAPQCQPAANMVWAYCGPPNFTKVKATARLLYTEAMALAQKTVFKEYRVSDVDVKGRPIDINGGLQKAIQGQKIFIPGYGRLERRQQILLQKTQVEQVRPQPEDALLRDAFGRPITVNFYNGYSRDKPAVCYGSEAMIKGRGTFWFLPDAGRENSRPTSQIFADFDIDPIEQVVRFSRYVYKTNGIALIPATPVLQTGVLIRNAETGAIECFQAAQLLPNKKGETNFQFQKCEDVQLNLIGIYNDQNAVTGVETLEADAMIRSKYILAGMAAQYPTETGLSVEYNGIIPIDLDGARRQVTWSVSVTDGATTQASINSEHSFYVPPYPARRREEYLRVAQQETLRQQANPQRAAQNLMRPQ